MDGRFEAALERCSVWDAARSAYDHHFVDVVMVAHARHQTSLLPPQFDIQLTMRSQALVSFDHERAATTGLRLVRSGAQILATYDQGAGVVGKFQAKFHTAESCAAFCAHLVSSIKIVDLDANSGAAPNTTSYATPAGAAASQPAASASVKRKRVKSAAASAATTTTTTTTASTFNELESLVLECLEDADFPALVQLVERTILHVGV